MRTCFYTAILASAIGAVPTIPARGEVRPPGPAEKPVANQQTVPVRQVVLYTSGVGYFEHYGSVKGDGFTELHFKTAQLNDILKSLVLEDLDKGKISSVTYGSQEPLAHTLKSFEVDLSAAPPLNELLSQLRGASVTATLSKGQVSGQILSVEKKQKPVGEKGMVDLWVLNLLLPGGAIRPVELDTVGEIRLDDAKLQQELVKALSAVAASRDQDSKPVAIRFSGQGERRVRIGYVVEAPVWKASYRLMLTEEAKNEAAAGMDAQTREPADPGKGSVAAAKPLRGGNLQGWAIVENQTDSDWENIQLSLVSGRPISFVEDLYQPLYIARPVVEPELYASLRPQRYTGGLDLFGAAAKDGSDEKQMFSQRKAAAPMAPMARQQRLAADAIAADKPEELKRAIDPTRSVSSLASGASVGEFFQYTVGDVTLARQKSAMIPIVTDAVKAARLSIFNAAVLPDHPLLGVRLTNTTGKLLPHGPITVLDAGAYAGDATIEDLPNGQSRLLSFGIDQSLLIHDNDQTSSGALVTAKLVKGVLELKNKQVFRQVYTADNKGKTDRTLLIEHPRRSGWGKGAKLVQPEHPLEITDALYRFEENVPAGHAKSLTVQEELTYSQGIAILPMNVDQLEVYFRTAQIPDDVKKALQKAATFKHALIDADRQIQDRQQQINEITQEQNRIRENMKAVAPSSDYYQRLVKELDAQETQLQTLKNDLKSLKQKREDQQKALEAYLQELSVG